MKLFGVTLKKCSKCGQVKTLSKFHRDSKKTDGRMAACAECCNAEARAKRALSPGRQKTPCEWCGEPALGKICWNCRAVIREKCRIRRRGADKEKAKARVGAKILFLVEKGATRFCPWCQQELPVDHFGALLRYDQLAFHGYCKKCKSEYNRARSRN